MRGQTQLFSSARGDWGTPRDFFDRLHQEFGFVLDAAASPHNAKCSCFYSLPDEDALVQDWAATVAQVGGGAVWLNPPYGRGLEPWFVKVRAEQARGVLTVVLVPARTDTRWFHTHVLGHAELRFVPGRLRFEVDGARGDAAPFPSILAVFRPYTPKNHDAPTFQRRPTPATRRANRGRG